MRDNLLSALFSQDRFTGAEHVHTTGLLTFIGTISAVVLIFIAVSLAVRHLTIISLRISARTSRHRVAQLLEKEL